MIDSDHPAVRDFARVNGGGEGSPLERAVRLYYAVRDSIHYDLYSVDLTEEGLRASTTLSRGRGWCVAKAVLLAACCRASGIPARLGFADVRNHLTTERMRVHLKSDLLMWHGYASLLLKDKWVRATPAFDPELCERFHIKSLDFDGHHDALLHPFDEGGLKHMEYVRYRGEFADVPLASLRETFERNYPLLLEGRAGDFDTGVDAEHG
jgi:transglutaminase-like putative cysteine protease